MVTKELFLDLGNKGFAYKYSLSNKRGFTVVISDFGGTILNLWVPDRDGNLRDVVLGLQNAENYRDHNPDFQGATVGRYANRIAGGKFMLDGRNYQLPVNNPPNSLHGGVNNFSNRLWQAKTNDFGDNGGELILKLFSPDGDEGYPADLHVEVKFTVTADNTLIIDYRGESDAPTVINLTNHSYFNLNGAHTCGIDDHYLNPYLNYIKDNKKLFKITLAKTETLNLNKSYQQLYLHILDPIMNRYQINQKERKYIVAFYINGIMAIIKEWLKEDCKESQEEILELIKKCVKQP